MRFLSVCSGIEAASVAWNPLGWHAAAFSEIEPFPCAVLAHHYPNTPNRGDMTKYKDWPDEPIDLLCGGTPCQSFSVAGLRKGLDDPRGNLMLTFCAIAAKYRPRWLVWENVPGVLSSGSGRDFGSFLGLLGILGYGFAYRVLDAQYFGLAQRRKRVFVVGCLGDWRSAAAVLFERHSLQGHPAPSRQTGKVAPTIPSRSLGGGGLGTDFDCDGGLIHCHDIAPTLNAHFGDKQGLEDQHINGGGDCLLPHVSMALNAGGMGRQDAESETLIPTLGGHFDVAHSLRGEGLDASEDGTGRGTPLVPVSYGIRTANTSSNGWGIQEEVTHTLDRAMGIAVAALPFDTTQITSAANFSNPKAGDPCHPLAAHAHAPCIAFPERMSATQCASTEDLAPSMGALNPTAVAVALRGRDGGATAELGDEVGNALRASGGGGDKAHVLASMSVRRLTPKECARLQGFPDHYLDINYRGKPAADGPKYKALGNSWAVPVVRWIGQRIEAVEAIGGLT